MEWAWSESALSWDVVTKSVAVVSQTNLSLILYQSQKREANKFFRECFSLHCCYQFQKNHQKKQFLSPWSPPLLPEGKQMLSRFDPCASSKKIQEISHFCSCVLAFASLIYGKRGLECSWAQIRAALSWSVLWKESHVPRTRSVLGLGSPGTSSGLRNTSSSGAHS